MKNENDFFKGIEDTLHAYEEAYVPGAWEAFQQKRDRKPAGMLFLKISSAAAVLLLVSYAAFMFWDKTPSSNQVTGNKPTRTQLNKPVPSSMPQNLQPSFIDTVNPPAQSGPVVAAVKPWVQQPALNRNVIDPGKSTITAPYTDDKVVDNNVAINNPPLDYPVVVKPDTGLIAVNNNPPVNNKGNVNTPSGKPAGPVTQTGPQTAVNNQTVATNSTAKQPGADKPIYDELIKNRSAQTAAVANNDAVDQNNLSYSVVVQPGIGNQKVNVGTGVQVAYKLNDKFSITSGVSYSSLNATAPGSVGGARISNVQHVDLQVSGVEIPLGVQYKTTKGYYVSAGVMGMSVINNRMEYSYIAQNPVATTMVNKEGVSFTALTVVSENKTEESKEKLNNYLGFYILSAGKKQAIGKKNTLIFGPFLRVPFGAVSSEKVRLLQGGVTLGFGF